MGPEGGEEGGEEERALGGRHLGLRNGSSSPFVVVCWIRPAKMRRAPFLRLGGVFPDGCRCRRRRCDRTGFHVKAVAAAVTSALYYVIYPAFCLFSRSCATKPVT